MGRKLFTWLFLPLVLGGCVTEIHVTGDNNRIQIGPQAETRAGRDVTAATTTADVQANPVTSFLPW